MRPGRTWITGAVLAVTLSGMGFTSVPTAQAPRPAPRVVTIVIQDVAFGAAPKDVRVGDTIEWVNKDIVDHTATERGKLWDVEVPPGKKVRVVMKKAGSFEYYCRYHPNMVGRVSVTK